MNGRQPINNNTHLVNVLIEHIYVEFSGSTVITSLHSNGTQKKKIKTVRWWLRTTTETMEQFVVVVVVGVPPIDTERSGVDPSRRAARQAGRRGNTRERKQRNYLTYNCSTSIIFFFSVSQFSTWMSIFSFSFPPSVCSSLLSFFAPQFSYLKG